VQTISALRIILHRLRGPLNLYWRGEQAVAAQPLRLEGMDLVRVPVRNSRAGVAAYYFDARTHLLKLATAGADAPGGEGTVTVYTYRRLPGGLAFPSRLAVYRIGRNVLVGDQPVLEVDYQSVRP
jgi:hypothetical protein